MARFAGCLLVVIILTSGCVTVNRDPDILLQEPYTRVTYVAEPSEHYKTVEVIQVETRGVRANIRSTIPLLYEKVLEYSGNREVDIGNISISSYTKLESVQVPYQDCGYVPRMVSVPRTSCYQGSCQTTYSTETRMERRCTTRYRTEMRNVLCQIASADVLTRNQE